MKFLLLLLVYLGLLSCNKETKTNITFEKLNEGSQDTVIVTRINQLNASYEIGFYSKSYSYYWVVGKDTLDFFLNATVLEKDSTLHLSIHHKNPMLFAEALGMIKASLHLVNENFDLSKLSSFYFRSPIYYKDLSKTLSKGYEEKIGKKKISYQKLHQFLLGSEITGHLNNFLHPMSKQVVGYGVEKFQLVNKEDKNFDLRDIDLSGHPGINIHGMGFSVRMASIK